MRNPQTTIHVNMHLIGRIPLLAFINVYKFPLLGNRETCFAVVKFFKKLLPNLALPLHKLSPSLDSPLCKLPPHRQPKGPLSDGSVLSVNVVRLQHSGRHRFCAARWRLEKEKRWLFRDFSGRV